MFIINSGINGIGISPPDAKSITSPNMVFIPFDVTVFSITPYIIIIKDIITSTDKIIAIMLKTKDNALFGAIIWYCPKNGIIETINIGRALRDTIAVFFAKLLACHIEYKLIGFTSSVAISPSLHCS